MYYGMPPSTLDPGDVWSGLGMCSRSVVKGRFNWREQATVAIMTAERDWEENASTGQSLDWKKNNKKCVKNNKAGRTLIEEPRLKDRSMYIHFNSQQLLWHDTLITYNLQRSKRARRRSVALSQEGEKARVFAWAHPFNRWSLRCSFSSSTNLPVSNEVRGLSVGESRRHPLVSSISINVHGLLIIPWLINTPRTCPYSSLNKDSFINDEY